jgi:hypothetical protein
VPHNTPAFREWREAALLAFITAGRDKDASPLDQDGVNVRGPVGAQLLRCDGAPYERDVTSWHSQDCLLQLVVAQGRQLLARDHEDRVGSGSSGGKSCVCSIEKNKSPP